MMLFLEFRVFGKIGSEVSKCLLQVSECLLKRYRANLVQKIKVFLFFPTRQHGIRLNAINPFESFVPSLCASSQSQVIR
jgi:hypothetical protein